MSNDPMADDFIPSEAQKRHRERERLDFARRWEFDVTNREFRRRTQPWWGRALDLLLGRRQNATALWAFATREWAEASYMGFAFPLQDDGLPIPGFPRKFALQSGYSIRKKDWRFLKGGAIYSRDLGRLIVSPYPAREALWRGFRDIVVPVVGFAGSVAGIAVLFAAA